MPTVAELGQRVKAKYPGSYDDLPDDELGRRVKSKYPGSYDDFADAPAAPAKPTAYDPVNAPGVYPEGFWDDMTGWALSWAPSVGGFVGGVGGAAVGGPGGAVAGATAGGALGETIREYGSGDALDAGKIAARGGLEGLWQTAGGAIAKGAGKVAGPLMKKALGNTSAIARRYKTTPDAIAQFNLALRVPPNAKGEASVQAANKALRMERSGKFAATGGTVSAKTLATKAIEDAEKNLGRSLTKRERFEMILKVQREADDILARRTHGVVPKASPGTPAQPASKLLDEYGQPAIPAQPAKAGKPSRYTARELEQIKEVAAKDARGAYSADRKAQSVAADPVLSKQIARGARRKLATIPGVSDLNSKIKQTIASEQAIAQATTRTGEWTPFHLGPVSLGAKVPPEKLGNLALLLSDPKFQKYAQQSPRALAALIAQMIYTDDPDATGGETP